MLEKPQIILIGYLYNKKNSQYYSFLSNFFINFQYSKLPSSYKTHSLF